MKMKEILQTKIIQRKIRTTKFPRTAAV